MSNTIQEAGSSTTITEEINLLKDVETVSATARAGTLSVQSKLKNDLVSIDANADDVLSKYMLPTKTIQISPLPVTKWHKKIGKDSFSRGQKVGPLVDMAQGGYVTGLTKEEREYLEAKTGFKLNSNFNPAKEHPYWDITGKVMLPNNTVILNLVNPIHYIRYKFLMFSPVVANSKAEWDEGLWPEATHYLNNEDDEAKHANTKTVKIQQVTAAIFNMQPEQKKKVLTVLTGKSVYNKSDEFINDSLQKAATANPEKAISVINMDKSILALRTLIATALNYGVIRKKKLGLFYKEANLGIEVDDVISLLNAPEGQDIYMSVKDDTTKYIK